MENKKRSINELRQTKDTVYVAPKANSKVIFDIKTVVDLIKKYPNDSDLGGIIRKFYLNNG